MKSRLLLILMILIAYTGAEAQESPQNKKVQRLGINFGGGINLHKGPFSEIPGVPNCCPEFDLGSGMGVSGGLLYELPLTENLFISGRINIFKLDGEYKTEESAIFISDHQKINGTFEHTLNSEFTSVGIEPGIMYNVFSGFNIGFNLRASTIIDSKYEQKEQITDPVGFGTFLDENGDDTYSRVRNENSGEISDLNSIILHAGFSLSYELPLNRSATLLLAPELSYHHPLNSVAKDITWSIAALRGGISIKFKPNLFMPEKEIEIHEEPVAPAKPKEEKLPVLTASINIVGVDKEGREMPEAQFVIEEFLSTVSSPLLNYIFFGPNSAEIPERYMKYDKDNLAEFDIDELYFNNTIDKYYQILNIIGLRLKNNPRATISLTGCNTGVGEEKDNNELSQSRAESVKNYLSSTWGIDPVRISVTSRNLPSKPTLPHEDDDAMAENRRVEIESNDPQILSPLVLTDTLRFATPPIARFYPEIKSEAGIRQINIKAYQFDEQDLYNLDTVINDMPDEYIDWQISANQKRTPGFDEPIKARMILTDKSGQEKETEEASLDVSLITIQKKRKEYKEDKEFKQFSLILFDFDNADIKGDNKKITSFIKSTIKNDSKVTIIGYSDRIGDADYNRDLSYKRARNTQKALGINNSIIKGVGEEKLIYNNDIPEGRFYSRTVDIFIETPVEN